MSRIRRASSCFALCIPGLRNIVEYHAELLFARGQTLVRMVNLALLAGAKAVLLTFVLTRGGETVRSHPGAERGLRRALPGVDLPDPFGPAHEAQGRSERA